MRVLSKSKLLSYRQCAKRLWLEIHRPDLREDSSQTTASFATGHQVGDVARLLYDPKGKGTLVDVDAEGFEAAFARSQELLAGNQPIFEAGFKAGGALAFADVMLPTRKAGKRAWRMVEVKSSTSVKDYHRDDAAIQAFVARQSGVALTELSLAHIDSSWVYPGKGDYSGLLKDNDLTQEAFGRGAEVTGWIKEAQAVVGLAAEPKLETGRQCSEPYECGFWDYCRSQEPQAEFPLTWLPRLQSTEVDDFVRRERVIEMADVPDSLLNERQRRVKEATLTGKAYFNATATAQALAQYKLPAYFMDFETIQFAVPVWKGTRPYQQIPFQFSVQRLSRTGQLKEDAFLDLSGGDPSKGFAEALIEACGTQGPIYVYNAAFESSRINDLATRFPRMRTDLQALNTRIVDLLPIAREHYYHPSQQGSWSIKKVLPAVVSSLSYADLDGVQDGGMAMETFLEALHSDTTVERKQEIERQLLAYCGLDTYAMVRLWQVFAGRKEWEL